MVPLFLKFNKVRKVLMRGYSLSCIVPGTWKIGVNRTDQLPYPAKKSNLEMKTSSGPTAFKNIPSSVETNQEEDCSMQKNKSL